MLTAFCVTKIDKRNLHLANVGRIDNNSGALWTDMSAKDQAKRLTAIRNKVEKLKVRCIVVVFLLCSKLIGSCVCLCPFLESEFHYINCAFVCAQFAEIGG